MRMQGMQAFGKFDMDYPSRYMCVYTYTHTHAVQTLSERMYPMHACIHMNSETRSEPMVVV